MEKREKKKPFFLRKFFVKEDTQIKKLKEIKKKIRKIKTWKDLDALEDELLAIGVIDEQALEKIRKLKNKKKRKSEKEMFEERIRCNLEIINQTIAVGKQFKLQERQRKDEELMQNREERTPAGNKRQKDRDEKVR